MFGVRLRSSIILMAVTILMMVLGGLPLFLAVGAISIIGLFELYRVVGFEKTGLAICGYVLAALYEVLVWFGLAGDYMGQYAMGTLIVLLAVYVLTFPKYDAPKVVTAFFGIFYVVVTLSCIYLIRCLEGGQYLVWLVFICAWGCDTLAYCTGMLIGKHKMTPELSPKKTVEGGIGGVVGAALLGAVFALIFRDKLTVFEDPVLSLAVMGAAGGLISMIGDLAASAFKRNYGIKDYGTLIPGHGGIMDRFDSIIVTAPIVYYLILFMSR